MDSLYIILALCAVIYSLIVFINQKFQYFKKRGIPQLETEFFYGNGRALVHKKLFQGEFYNDIYKKFKALGVQQGGIYIALKPIWVPIDPKLIKTILIKDYSYFSAHLKQFTHSLFVRNLFFMDGEEWKDMRRKLTPTFTSGKMKMMFNILLEKTNGLRDLIDKVCKTGEATEIKQLLSRFTTDVIGSCGFGIECNSIVDINSEFYTQSQKIFKDAEEPSFFHLLLVFIGLRRNISSIDFKPMETFFRNAVRDTIKYREENKIIRRDFLHLMIQLKNKGVITELTRDNDDKEIFIKTVDNEVMSLDDITGQCLLFFNAGFETSSTTMSYALLELSQYQDVQKKLREEVRKVLQKHDGKLSYDAIQDMSYLDWVVNETLRKYPPVPVLPRLCTKTYTIPGTNSVIEKGTTVNIPVWGLHMDPDNFPDPEKFIPDRFSPENKSQIKEMTYLPFGEGPRMCLGLRFGVMQSKAGLATLINSYNFTLDKKTPYPPEYKKTLRLISTVEGGIWLKATKVD